MINSISLNEDSLVWTDLVKKEKMIEVKRAVREALPLFINHKSIQQATSSTKLSDFLKTLMQQHGLKKDITRLTIPGRFTIIKKIVVDESIPETQYPDLVVYEFEKMWEESTKNYNIYLPEANQSSGELIALAIRKNVLEFFESIFDKAGLSMEAISPSCFTIDEFFRTLFPNSSGQTLLLGWQRNGFDAIIADANRFISYFFKPYSTNLDHIEKINDFELANGFSNLLYNLQHPPTLENPLYDIKSIYNFGFYFKPEWLDFMRSRVEIPINLLNFDATSGYQLKIDSPQISSDLVYHYIEPLSNIF